MTAIIMTTIMLAIFFFLFASIRHRAAKDLAIVNAAKQRIEGELSIARSIQMSMVPNKFPNHPGIDMYASMTPAKEVGGDLYGYVLNHDVLYFCIGDVSGKGVPASLIMAQAMRLFHVMATNNLSPTRICMNMNAELSGEDNENSMFITLIVFRLNLTHNLLEFCNAGHNPPLLASNNAPLAFLPMESNAPIGLWPELEYKGNTIHNFKDQLLLLYTDGLNEAENTQQEQFGEERIIDTLASTSSKKAQDIVENLKNQVNIFRNGAEPSDDLTLLCLKTYTP